MGRMPAAAAARCSDTDARALPQAVINTPRARASAGAAARVDGRDGRAAAAMQPGPALLGASRLKFRAVGTGQVGACPPQGRRPPPFLRWPRVRPRFRPRGHWHPFFRFLCHQIGMQGWRNLQVTRRGGAVLRCGPVPSDSLPSAASVAGPHPVAMLARSSSRCAWGAGACTGTVWLPRPWATLCAGSVCVGGALALGGCCVPLLVGEDDRQLTSCARTTGIGILFSCMVAVMISAHVSAFQYLSEVEGAAPDVAAGCFSVCRSHCSPYPPPPPYGRCPPLPTPGLPLASLLVGKRRTWKNGCVLSCSTCAPRRMRPRDPRREPRGQSEAAQYLPPPPPRRRCRCCITCSSAWSSYTCTTTKTSPRTTGCFGATPGCKLFTSPTHRGRPTACRCGPPYLTTEQLPWPVCSCADSHATAKPIRHPRCGLLQWQRWPVRGCAESSAAA
jgi:hypothetical protein